MLLIARTLVVGASLAAFALVGVMFNSARATSPPYPSSGVTFRDFNGAVYLSSPEIDKQLGIGWTRQDFSWSSIEPDKGKWSWDKMDQLVQGAHAQSVEVLPVLDYTAPWAASIPGQQFSAPRHVEDWEDYVEHVVARYSQPPFNLR
jgi:GH35 family endo-1,4-beta-xylanase